MTRHPARKSHLNRRLIALAVASCFATGLAFANPTAPTVVNGSASILRSGNLLQITNSPNAIINWGSFSIGASEITRFIQQSQASAVLNRVIGQDPSSILGALQSNGRVFLINPNGILFGAGAQIDVAGLVASTLNLSNADFLAGRLKFTEVPGAGSIMNQGNITTGQGGNVYLVAPDITNSGIITSPKGEVVLAAGKSVELVEPGTPNLRVEISAPDNAARNLGQIVADSGRIGIYAGLINHSGTIRADSAVVGENGKIVLKATKNVTLESGSVTSASGPSGGRIEIQSGDTTLVAGSVEAKGTFSPPSEGGVSPAGDGVVGEGGTIHILGNRVGLIDNARIDASGQTGGGTVLIGGDYQGKNPDVQNAWRTYFGPSATIKADAIEKGDGGKVIVWADEWTKYYGSISARGGASSGNGGFVETSGKQNLDFNGSVNVLAPKGAAGSVLLDPTSITIVAGTAGSGANDVDVGSSSPNVLFADNGGAAYSISSGTLEALTGNITLQSQAQTTVNAALNLSNQIGGTTVKFQAGGNMDVNQPITTAGGSLILIAGDPAFSATSPTPGLIIASGANLTTNGGDITLQNQKTATVSGINIGANVNAGSGIVHMTTAGGGIGQQAGAVITASALEIQTVGGVNLNESNNVGTLAASVSSGDDFAFKNAQTLVIGTVGGVSGITTKGGAVNLTAQGAGALLTVTGNIDTTNGGGTPAGASVTLTADDLDISGAVNAGANTVTLRPTTLTQNINIESTPTGGVMSLTPTELQNVTAGTLEIGRLTDTGSLHVSTPIASSNINAGTLRLQHQNVFVDANIGSFGAEFNHNLEIKAIDTNTIQNGANILLADNNNLLLSVGTNPVGPSLTLGGGTLATTIQVGTTASNTGSMTLQGRGVFIGASGSGADTIARVFGSGNQTITSTGDITFENASTTSGILLVRTENGAQTITAAGTLQILGGTGTNTSASVQTVTGLQTVSANSILVHGGDSGTGNFANIVSGGNQDVSASSGITLTGGASGGGLNTGNSAVIQSSGSQSISVGNGGLTLTGGGGVTDNLAIVYQAGLTGTNQTITVSGGGTITLQGGSGTQSSVGFPHGSLALIRADGDLQQIDFTAGGAINATGGTVGSRNFASIFSANGAQTITGAPSITLTGGASGGVAGEGNNASISASVGTQTITAGSVVLTGGAGGTNNSANIGSGSDQSVSASGITLTGGSSGDSNFADIHQQGASASQAITVNAGGTVALQGGGGSNNFSRIRNDGTGQQTINFASGGAITIAGGIGTASDFAQIRALAGTQTISGSPTILIQGGTGGSSSQGNFAIIIANADAQTITAGATTITAGASGTNNFATIESPTQTITVNGDLTLAGGGSVSGPVNGAGARVGGVGGATTGPTNLTLTVSGDVNMTGGSAADAGSAIGSNFAGGQATDITMNVGGNFLLNPGTVANAGSRIGSPTSNVAGGDISVTVGGNVSMNGSTHIRTLGAVTLDAAGSLTMTAGSGTSESVLIQSADTQMISASGITLTGGAGGTSNFAQILQTGTSATQTITINNGGTLALQAGAGNNNQAHIVNQGTLQTINFTSGGNLNLTGGTVGQQNEANIDADSGNQVISGNPNITLQGGASGGASGFEGNQAGIVSNVGTQTISANNLSITGGGGINASAGIFADPGGAQTINVAGTTTLTGGSGIDSVAFIGGDIGNVNVTLNATGPVTITGGTGAVGVEGFGALAGIGAPGGFNADVTINGQAGIALNKGATGGQGDAFIGSDTGGGTITLKAGLGGAGSLALNDGRVGTTGNVTLQAIAAGGQITQTAAGVIRAATLTASANSGISLPGANDLTQIVVPSAGTVTLNDVNAIVLNGIITSGALGVTAGGAITQSGAITVSGASSFSAGANPITLTNSGNDFTGAVSLNNSGPNNVAITDANAIVLGTSSVGTGTLTVIATGANTITQTGPIVQAAGAGVASFQTGGGAITLTNAANDFTGPINAGAGLAAVAITDANALILFGGGGADTIGDFTLNANGTVSQNSAFGGTVGNVVVNAGVGPIVFTDPGNNVVATSIAVNTTGAASLTNAAAVNFAASSIGGALSLTAGGVTQTGAITVGGTSTINAGANPITLTNSGNSFTGAVSLSNSLANDAAIASTGTLNLGASSVGGSLTASASGAGSNLNLSGASAVGGNAGLTAGQDVNLGAGLSVGSNLTLAGGGHVRVTDATVSTGGALSVNASFLDITANAGPARLQAGTNLSVAAGDVTLQGGSVNAASAELRAGPGAFGITTTGNVLLTGGSGVGAFSRIFGDPDANMTVGGVLQMNAGSGAGAFAVIEAASVASINLIFPNLVSGGYFVNGVEGALFDAATGSGFIAGGAPAAPGQGFNVSYGLAAPTVITAPLLTAQIVATEEAQQTAASDPTTQELGQATTTVSAASVTVNEVSSMVEGPAAVADAKEDKKETAAPICR